MPINLTLRAIKGSPLSNDEMDTNFQNLANAAQQALDTANQALASIPTGSGYPVGSVMLGFFRCNNQSPDLVDYLNIGNVYNEMYFLSTSGITQQNQIFTISGHYLNLPYGYYGVRAASEFGIPGTWKFRSPSLNVEVIYSSDILIQNSAFIKPCMIGTYSGNTYIYGLGQRIS